MRSLLFFLAATACSSDDATRGHIELRSDTDANADTDTDVFVDTGTEPAIGALFGLWDSDLIEIDATTGVGTQTGTVFDVAGIREVAIDPSGHWFAARNDEVGAELLSIDPCTGVTVPIGPVTLAGVGAQALEGLVILPDGSALAAVAMDPSQLSKSRLLADIDLQTGELTSLADIPWTIDDSDIDNLFMRGWEVHFRDSAFTQEQCTAFASDSCTEVGVISQSGQTTTLSSVGVHLTGFTYDGAAETLYAYANDGVEAGWLQAYEPETDQWTSIGDTEAEGPLDGLVSELVWGVLDCPFSR